MHIQINSYRRKAMAIGLALLSTCIVGVRAEEEQVVTTSNPDKAFCWKVTPKDGKGGKVYIMGGFHRGRSDMLLPLSVQAALRESDVLAVQVDTSFQLVLKNIIKYTFQVIHWTLVSLFCLLSIEHMIAFTGLRSDRGILKAVELSRFLSYGVIRWTYLISIVYMLCTFVFFPMFCILARDIDSDTYWELRKALSKSDMPWYLKLYVAYILPTRAIMFCFSRHIVTKVFDRPELGMEYYLIPIAQKEGKQIVRLENFSNQLKVLRRMDYRPNYTLQKFLNDLPKLEKVRWNMVRAWKTGNRRLMYKCLRYFDRRIEGYKSELIDKRNAKMVDKIKVFLQGDKVVFVALGAFHLVGRKGVIAQLKAAGYHVEQLTE